MKTRRKRARWVCRLLGHQYRSPYNGWVIHFYLPSAEGSMGYSDPRGKLIGICRCGDEWWSNIERR